MHFGLTLVLLAQLPAAPLLSEITIERLDPAPKNGRLFVVFSKREFGPGVFSQNWFSPEPFYAASFNRWPDRFRPDVGFPGPLHALKPGTYFVQAILDRDQGGMNPLASPGNRYGKAIKVELDPTKPPALELKLDQTVPEKPFVESDRVKLFRLPSPLLTAFHGKAMSLQAGVVLPKNYDPKKAYPIVYEIPGFSGTHHLAFAAESRNATDVAGSDMIQVVLDPSCRRGHHVFADSANNGPVGAALVGEFIPALEAKYGGVRPAKHRFLTGHSSGGWSSLWLQIAYPDFFGGVWSTAPDSVDFRDFQLVDLYAPQANLFFDAKGDLRPIARKDGKVALTTKRFSDMEVVLGRGGQLFSFEAVFSPSGPDGEPRKMWDRKTGAVDPAIAESWRKYDIRQIVEKDWPTLGPKLKGKIHIFMGAEDTFYLDGATRLLKASLEKLGSDAIVEIVPGKHHGNLIDAGLRARMAKEMRESAGR